MELVKQRKRRLLAWLLTIALCIGIWQGNAYATDGTVNLYLKDEKGNRINFLSKEVAIEGLGGRLVSGKESEVADYITFDLGSSGEITLNKTNAHVDGSTTTGSDLTFQHNVIGWKSEDGTTDLEEPLTLTGKTPDFIAVLGKSLHVYYSGWDGTSEDNELPPKSQKSSSDTWKTKARPEVEGTTGQFFEWLDQKSNEYYLPETEYSYPAFEAVLNLTPQFSNAVSGLGTYSLKAGSRYRLGSGTWSVNNDGYSYSGDQSFYVASDGEYKFE